MVLKMSFCKLLHGIESGNDADLRIARSLYIKILCVRERPLSFFLHQGKAPEEILQNVAGSLGHVTALLGTLCVGFLCRKQGKFVFVNEKSFEMANVGGWRKAMWRGRSGNEIKPRTSLKMLDL